MAQDPYGNEIDDPFDKAIAQGVMRSTWWSGALALLLPFAPMCCLPGRLVGVIGAPFMMIPVFVFAALAMAAAINVTVRVFTMQPEHKRLIPGWQPWAALGLGVVGFCLAGLQMLGAALSLFLG